MRWVAFLLLLAAPAGAEEHEEIECWNATTQSGMNICAKMHWDATDRKLNDAYADALKKARLDDSYGLHPELPKVEDMLRHAQRAWITFRDASCAHEETLVRGGSMQPMMFWGCMAALTEERTKHLVSYAKWPE